MERYVFELSSNDKIFIDDQVVAIDGFVSIDEELVYIQGYYVDTGDDFEQMYSLNDVVRIS
jgi:hypothetical protein